MKELHLLTKCLQKSGDRRREKTLQDALYVFMMCGWDLKSNYWEERCGLNVLSTLHKLTLNRMYLALQEFDLATLSSRRNVSQIPFLYPLNKETITLIQGGERIKDKYWEEKDNIYTEATECLCCNCRQKEMEDCPKRVAACMKAFKLGLKEGSVRSAVKP